MSRTEIELQACQHSAAVGTVGTVEDAGRYVLDVSTNLEVAECRVDHEQSALAVVMARCFVRGFAVGGGGGELEAVELTSVTSGDIPESSSPQEADTEKPAKVGES